MQGMARKKEEELLAPLWMCTFGDLMSLLLCFFIMLFAISIISEPRFQALVDTLRQDFEGYATPSKVRQQKVQVTTTVSDSAARRSRTAALTGGQPTPAPEGTSTEVLAILLDGTTVRNGLIRFELGDYAITPQARRELDALLPVLQGSPFKILVKGYAAPTEIEGDNRFQRSTDLAFFRALSIVDYFAEKGLIRDFFEISVEPGASPRRAIWPAGTLPEHADASAEILLLNQTLRSLRE